MGHAWVLRYVRLDARPFLPAEDLVLKLVAFGVAVGLIGARIGPAGPAAMPNVSPDRPTGACATTDVGARTAHSLAYDASTRRIVMCGRGSIARETLGA